MACSGCRGLGHNRRTCSSVKVKEKLAHMVSVRIHYLDLYSGVFADEVPGLPNPFKHLEEEE